MAEKRENFCGDVPAKLSAVDLFCGAGGISLGLQSAGFNVVCAADSSPIAMQTYRQNFSHPSICIDLVGCSAAEILRRAGVAEQRVDLVVGGPPCQGFSVQRIGPDEDERNNLVMQFARMISEFEPRLFLMENVPGLLGKRGRGQLNEFVQAMSQAGYDSEAHLLNAADYGVPQIRKRIIVLGWHRSSGAPVILPKPTHRGDRYVTVEDAIGDLPAASPPGECHGADPLHRTTRMSQLNLERLKHIPPGGGMENLPVNLRVDCHKAGADKIGHRYVYGRLDGQRPASTITARFDSFTRGRFAHPRTDRNISLREGARLQTFPDTFRFAGNQEEIAAQIGNAVPPRLAFQLAASFVQAASCGREASAEPRRSTETLLTSTRRTQLSLALLEPLT